VDTFVADSNRAVLLAAAGDAVTDPLKADQLFGVDLDHVAGLGPLVPADWLFGLQVSQATKPDVLEPTANSRERRCQVFGDALHCEALMAQCPGLLLLLQIERPPLSAAHTPSIRQRSRTA
jgi:hypothetical protein